MEKYHAVAWQLNPGGVRYHAEELLRVFRSGPTRTAPGPQAGKHPPVASGCLLLHLGDGMEFKPKRGILLPCAEPRRQERVYCWTI